MFVLIAILINDVLELIIMEWELELGMNGAKTTLCHNNALEMTEMPSALKLTRL